MYSLPICYWRRKWQTTPVFLPGENPWTEEPDEPQSTGSGITKSWTLDWVTNTQTHLYVTAIWKVFFFQSLMYYDFFCKCLSSVVEKNVHCVIVCGRILYVCFLTVHLKTYHNLTTYSWGICLDSSHKVNMRFLWTSQFFKIYLPRLSYYMKTSIKLFMLLSDLVHDYTVISTWWEKKSILY